MSLAYLARIVGDTRILVHSSDFRVIHLARIVGHDGLLILEDSPGSRPKSVALSQFTVAQPVTLYTFWIDGLPVIESSVRGIRSPNPFLGAMV